MNELELLEQYNQLFNDFLDAKTFTHEIKIYLKMKKINKNLKKLKKKTIYDSENKNFKFK